MADIFCLKCKDGDDGWTYLDIPYSHCAEDVELFVYGTQSSGKNQCWMLVEDRILSAINPKFCIAVSEVKEGAHVIIHDLNHSPHLFTTGWIIEDGYVKVANDDNLCLGLSDNNKIVLQNIESDSAIKTWQVQAINRVAKPASSCHLGFQPISSHDISDSWTLENTVCVRKSTDCTYYCTVGWGPGGYSGIQRISSTNRVAIFSMWNDHRHSVREIEHGPGVRVQTFGGEGTGMKSMKQINWTENQKVSIRITGRKHYDDAGNYSTWRVTGMYSMDEGTTWNLLATFERSGSPPLGPGGFYAFEEDWRRDHYHEGHLIQREAEFSDPKLITGNGTVHHLTKAVFTRVSQGEDAYAYKKAFGAVKKANNCFVLSTGGRNSNEVYRSLQREGCSQITNRQYGYLNL